MTKNSKYPKNNVNLPYDDLSVLGVIVNIS